MSQSSQFLTEMQDNSQRPPRALTRIRRVLFVTHDFPPNRTSATYRVTGLTQALPQLGWLPTVLTIQGRNFTQEPELLQKLPPEVKIVRTKFLPVNGWENKAASRIQNAGALKPQEAVGGKPPAIDSFLRSFAGLVRSTFYFPDHTVGWVPYALSAAIKLHRQNPFDVIYTTSPPRSAPLIGLLLKRFLRVPMVTELMDPWWTSTRPLRRRSDDWLHTQLLRRSDRLIVMLPQHAEELARSFQVPPEKLVIVRNGFFEDDFAAIENTEPNSLDPTYFHFSHFGTIYPGNEGEFFVALAEVLKERPELKSTIRLHLVGFPSTEVVRYTKQNEELKEITQYHGFLPKRKDTLQMMRSSDYLLLCWGRPELSRLAIAGKTYDYLRAGRPILAVTAAGGGIAELIKRAGAGWVLPPDDKQVIKKILRQILGELRKQRLNGPPRPDYVAQFRWDRLAEPLARALQEAVGDVTT